MKLLIHDIKTEKFNQFLSQRLEDTRIISNNDTINHCVGCFGCWIKTPGVCLLQDDYRHMGEWLSKCNEVIIISRCSYGSYSPFVKNVLDRSISYVHPYFVIRRGEMHHKRRYHNRMQLTVWFYGEEISQSERTTAKKLVEANALNFHCQSHQVTFIDNIAEMEGQIL